MQKTRTYYDTVLIRKNTKLNYRPDNSKSRNTLLDNNSIKLKVQWTAETTAEETPVAEGSKLKLRHAVKR